MSGEDKHEEQLHEGSKIVVLREGTWSRTREVTSSGVLAQEIGTVGLTGLFGWQQTAGKKEIKEDEDGRSESVKWMERGLSLTGSQWTTLTIVTKYLESQIAIQWPQILPYWPLHGMVWMTFTANEQWSGLQPGNIDQYWHLWSHLTSPFPLALSNTWLEIQLLSSLHESLNKYKTLLPSKKCLKTPDILYNFLLIFSQYFNFLQIHFQSQNVAFQLLWWCRIEIWRRRKHGGGFLSCVQRAGENLLQDIFCLEAWRKPLQNSPFPLAIATFSELQYEIILLGREKAMWYNLCPQNNDS